jgi:hypothetical protein
VQLAMEVLFWLVMRALRAAWLAVLGSRRL